MWRSWNWQSQEIISKEWKKNEGKVIEKKVRSEEREGQGKLNKKNKNSEHIKKNMEKEKPINKSQIN